MKYSVLNITKLECFTELKIERARFNKSLYINMYVKALSLDSFNVLITIGIDYD